MAVYYYPEDIDLNDPWNLFCERMFLIDTPIHFLITKNEWDSMCNYLECPYCLSCIASDID